MKLPKKNRGRQKDYLLPAPGWVFWGCEPWVYRSSLRSVMVPTPAIWVHSFAPEEQIPRRPAGTSTRCERRCQMKANLVCVNAHGNGFRLEF